MEKLKSQKRLDRQTELLKEFSHQVRDFYEEKQVGDKWYIKQYNGNSDRWQVAIYSNQSYRNYKAFSEKKKYVPDIEERKIFDDGMAENREFIRNIMKENG